MSISDSNLISSSFSDNIPDFQPTMARFDTLSSLDNLVYTSEFNDIPKYNISSSSNYSISTYNNLNVSSFRQSGRLPGLCTYETVMYNNKIYNVVYIQHKKQDIQFVIDESNLSKVLSRPWHLSSGKYIATNYKLDDKKNKEVYLHNFLMGDSVDESTNRRIIHINNNFLDNRLENLRLVNFSINKPKRTRVITLPPDCGFATDDIPKYISYVKPSGEHYDRFSIEIPQLNIFRKLTSSKKISLKDKLEEAKKTLYEIYREYPEADPNKDDELISSLNISFTKILESV